MKSQEIMAQVKVLKAVKEKIRDTKKRKQLLLANAKKSQNEINERQFLEGAVTCIVLESHVRDMINDLEDVIRDGAREEM